MVVLGVFTVGAGKRPVYLLPATPAIALLGSGVPFHSEWSPQHVPCQLVPAAARLDEWCGGSTLLAESG